MVTYGRCHMIGWIQPCCGRHVAPEADAQNTSMALDLTRAYQSLRGVGLQRDTEHGLKTASVKQNLALPGTNR